ncbi:MAG: type II toxin-antitoxin system RelE/ParE family toxin [Bryobacteraceae bacterium]
MQILFRPEARAEALEAQSWYESRSPGLGFEFVRSIEAALEAAARNPEAFTLVEGLLRRVILRRFPYSLIFRAQPKYLLVVAIFHHRRKPRSWVSRVGG